MSEKKPSTLGAVSWTILLMLLLTLAFDAFTLWYFRYTPSDYENMALIKGEADIDQQVDRFCKPLFKPSIDERNCNHWKREQHRLIKLGPNAYAALDKKIDEATAGIDPTSGGGAQN